MRIIAAVIPVQRSQKSWA